MKIYEGFDGHTVFVNGKPLNPRTDLVNHSPTGFSWGYGGSGPAQLAIALLADCVGDEKARKHYQEFKWGVLSKFKGDWILLETEIVEIVKGMEEKQHA